MISVAQAEAMIKNSTHLLPAESVSFSAASYRVLREPVCADRDLPPFDRVMMDGIAFAYEGWLEGIRKFNVKGLQPAGMPPLTLDNKEDCIEIMTGAVLTKGCDCVAPYEAIELSAGTALLKDGFTPPPGRYVHGRGSDYRKGDTLIFPGCRLTAREIAVVASCGKSHLAVTRQASVGIVSTGDELVEVEEEAAPYQIRRSNDHALSAALRGFGVRSVEAMHLKDDPASIEDALRGLLERTEVIILSGGISKGKFDYVPRILEKLGVQKHFHGVSQRPGKPFWYGEREEGPIVFALPGNPLATLVCFHRYVLPALEKMLGLPPPPVKRVSLQKAFTFQPPLTLFLPVKTEGDLEGGVSASPRPPQNSGDFASIVPTDGFVELPAENRDDFPKGYKARYFSWI